MEVRSPGAGVAGSFELLDMGAGHRAAILCESSMHSYLTTLLPLHHPLVKILLIYFILRQCPTMWPGLAWNSLCKTD